MRWVAKINDKRIVSELYVSSPPLSSGPADWPPGRYGAYVGARHCECCLLVYDVTNRRSFELAKWYADNFDREREQERYLCNANCVNICSPRPSYRGIKLLIANKIDVSAEEREVSTEEGAHLSAQIGATFMEMSAMTGSGCGSEVWLEVLITILWQRQKNLLELGQEWMVRQRRDRMSSPRERANFPFWY
jgi:hypothetical protein